jgi:hypothetical protein
MPWTRQPSGKAAAWERRRAPEAVSKTRREEPTPV